MRLEKIESKLLALLIFLHQLIVYTFTMTALTGHGIAMRHIRRRKIFSLYTAASKRLIFLTLHAKGAPIEDSHFFLNLFRNILSCAIKRHFHHHRNFLVAVASNLLFVFWEEGLKANQNWYFSFLQERGNLIHSTTLLHHGYV